VDIGGREGEREREKREGESEGERVCSSSAAFKLCSFCRSCRAVSDASGYTYIRGEVDVEALQLEIPIRQKLVKLEQTLY
jgi:hypothetical protein